MGEILLILLAVMLGVAALTRETYPLVLAYLLAGTYLISRWWPKHSLTHLNVQREFNDHVFLEEVVPVTIQLQNTSWLPAIWLNIRDLHPIDLAERKSFREIVSLSAHQKTTLAYELKAYRRGYYPVGPMTMESGDLFGLIDSATSEIHADYLTVYPRVIPLRKMEFPSSSPLGSLRSRQPIFEDPTRPSGKRDYQRGDALRRVDWKASASRGRLQVKIFEPSIDLQVALLLNLNTAEYHAKARYDGPELSIVTAASLASWIVLNRQAVGLFTLGADPLSADGSVQPLTPRKGQAHLMRLLETLARVKSVAEKQKPLREAIRRCRQELSWGTTLVIITGSADEALLAEFLLARQVGLKPVLLVCGWYTDVTIPIKRGASFGIPVRIIHSENDLRKWQL
jgi:uncharacterized protein (DUF58 family)